jgi:hypothetical protein
LPQWQPQRTGLFDIGNNGILLIIGLISCATPKLYREPENISVGKLSEKELLDLKFFLQPFTSGKQRDTLIIKYEINGESCWNNLDMRPDDYINKVLINGQNYRNRIANERQGVSFYHFKEKGNRTNRLIKWDKEIRVDEQGNLGQLLFKQKASCGSSAIVLPGGEYVIMLSDSHLIGFSLTKEMISEALRTKKIKNYIDQSGR